VRFARTVDGVYSADPRWCRRPGGSTRCPTRRLRRMAEAGREGPERAGPSNSPRRRGSPSTRAPRRGRSRFRPSPLTGTVVRKEPAADAGHRCRRRQRARACSSGRQRPASRRARAARRAAASRENNCTCSRPYDCGDLAREPA
jgi:hypothetical protein